MDLSKQVLGINRMANLLMVIKSNVTMWQVMLNEKHLIPEDREFIEKNLYSAMEHAEYFKNLVEYYTRKTNLYPSAKGIILSEKNYHKFLEKYKEKK